MISKNTVVLGLYKYIISLRDIVRNIYIYYLIKVYFGGKMWKCNKRKEYVINYVKVRLLKYKI